jgi:hypothetical protein
VRVRQPPFHTATGPATPHFSNFQTPVHHFAREHCCTTRTTFSDFPNVRVHFCETPREGALLRHLQRATPLCYRLLSTRNELRRNVTALLNHFCTNVYQEQSHSQVRSNFSQRRQSLSIIVPREKLSSSFTNFSGSLREPFKLVY